jgi:hypothetical protein
LENKISISVDSIWGTKQAHHSDARKKMSHGCI